MTTKEKTKCNLKTIDLLDRKDLIKIAKKLEIKGSKSNFTSPYRKKESIKSEILQFLKDRQIKKTLNKDAETSHYKPVKKLVAIAIPPSGTMFKLLNLF